MSDKWRCSDIGTAVYQGYASPIEKADLERICAPLRQTGNLPFTGIDLGLILIATVIIVVAGLLLRRAGR